MNSTSYQDLLETNEDSRRSLYCTSPQAQYSVLQVARVITPHIINLKTWPEDPVAVDANLCRLKNKAIYNGSTYFNLSQKAQKSKVYLDHFFTNS